MKRLLLGLALVASIVSLTEASNGTNCGCNSTTSCNFREECCKDFNACACFIRDVTCAGDCDGLIWIRVCKTSVDANSRVTVRTAHGKEVAVACCDVPQEGLPEAVQLACDVANPTDLIRFCVVRDLCAGDYVALVEQDCPRCSKEVPFTIGSPAPIVIDCKKVVCSHKDTPTGKITVKVTGGNEGELIVTADGTTPCTLVNGSTDIFQCSPVPCGRVTVTATDTLGCEAEKIVKVPCCESKSCSKDKHHKSRDHKRHSSKDHRKHSSKDHKKHSSKDHKKHPCKDHKKHANKAPKKPVVKTTPVKKGALIVAAAHARKNK